MEEEKRGARFELLIENLKGFELKTNTIVDSSKVLIKNSQNNLILFLPIINIRIQSRFKKDN